MCRVLFILVVFSISLQTMGQKHKKFLRQGNRDYKESIFEESELQYRKSIDVNPSYNDASFNLGDALYKQEKFEDAAKSFSSLAENEIDKSDRAGSYYNLGNALLKANKPAESIEAYKSALRLDPGSMQAKYNLAYAQDLLQQQEQNKEQQDGENNKDQQQDQEQNNEDQNKQDNQDQQEQQDQKNQQEQQQMTKEDAERLLQAIASDEEAVQQKVKEAKAAKQRVKTVKNW